MNDHSDALDKAPAQPLEIDLSDADVEVGEVRGFDVSQSQEETRSKIALGFTNFFLMLVGVAMLMPFVVSFIFPGTFADPLMSAKELVTLLASVLAGPFGFIVGFYFKQSTDNNNG